MQLTRMTKTAIVATSLVLGAGAATAAAVAAPDAADHGRTTGSEKAGFEVPVGPPEDEVLEETETTETTETTVEEETTETTEGEQPDNHGAAVSAVAQDDSLTGREHGEAVSEVARSDAGKPEQSVGKGKAADAPGKAKGGEDEGDDDGEGDAG